MLNFKTTEHTLQVVGGNVIKDHLQSLGAEWNSDNESWDFPISSDSVIFRIGIEEAFNTASNIKGRRHRDYDITPAGAIEKKLQERETIKKCLEENEITGAYRWICCEECEVIDWNRQYTNCVKCAEWIDGTLSSFRVRGVIRSNMNP